MRTYTVPRQLDGENRILLIFTNRSFLYTMCGAGIGLLIFFVFKMFSMAAAGGIVLALFSLIGYCLGAIVLPDSMVVFGGESLDSILKNLYIFYKNRCCYVYGMNRKEL